MKSDSQTRDPQSDEVQSSKRLINKNYLALWNALLKGKRGCVLEGGSRSGKTWSSIIFTNDLCLRPELGNRNASIFLVKETYNSFKTTLYDDFNKIMSAIPGVHSPFDGVKEVQSFWINGNKLSMMGADQPSKFHGAGCDYFWMNEGLDVSRAIFDQLEMRCRKFWWIDYNPKVSDHWVFDLEKRDDVAFFHSTLLDNPCISDNEKQKILSYEPTPDNIERGTADDYMWSVYGLGLRASPQGLVFPDVTWIDQFPDDVPETTWGLDFGWTNSPSALVRCGRNGRNLYLHLRYYEPSDNVDRLAAAIRPIVGNDVIWADSAEPMTIASLRRSGFSIFPARKPPGSVQFGIAFMKNFKIHIVRDPDFKKEQENYKWRVVQNITLNEPVDAYNHAWDASRYSSVMQWRNE